ncbi:MAG: phytanoyl-CoA dioxygenase family protein [Planctomycetota bacterium]
MTATAPLHEQTFKLSDDDLARYEKDGYYLSPKLLDDSQIEALRQAHERLWRGDFDGHGFPQQPEAIKPDQSYDPHAVRKIANGWWVNDPVRSLVTGEAIGSIARQLLKHERVRLWHDQVIYKPPTGDAGQVGNIGWHQDCGYWKAADTTNMATAWIALQDTDLSNGGMRSIAGSHHWGLIEDSDTFFDQDLETLHAKYSRLGEWRDEPCILPAGCASFHHGLCFHGSGPNTDDKPRLSVVAHLMPDGTAFSGSRQHHHNVALLGPRPVVGQRFEGVFFPRVGR